MNAILNPAPDTGVTCSADLPIARRLAERVHAVGPADVTPEAMAWATNAVADTIGVGLAGACEPCVQLLCEVADIDTASGPALVLGSARRVGLLDAALVNGTAAHALDYDDVCGVSGAHPSAPMVAPLMALAEANRLSGRELLVSFMVGVDVQNRLGRGVNDHHYVKGWHPTATLGIFGTAAACAHLLRLKPDQIAVALAMAASFAAGIKANFGTMTKPLHAGHAARDGLLAALLARKGYTANPGALEHKQGFLEVFNGKGTYDVARMFEDADAPIGVEPTLGIKQFPCCGSTHPAVAMMLQLMKEEGVRAADVEKIDVLAQPNRLAHTDNADPRDGLQAKFSIQYATARALADGAVRLEHFEGDAHLEPRVRALMRRLDARAHPDMPVEGNRFGSEVVVTMHDGRRLSRRVEHMVGRGPDNPLSVDELREKFVDCAKRALPIAQAQAVFERLARLAAAADVGELTRALETSGPTTPSR